MLKKFIFSGEIKKLKEEMEKLQKDYCDREKDRIILNEKIEETNRLITSKKKDLMGEQKRTELKIEERKLNLVIEDLKECESNVRSANAKLARLKAKKHEILMNCLVFIFTKYIIITQSINSLY